MDWDANIAAEDGNANEGKWREGREDGSERSLSLATTAIWDNGYGKGVVGRMPRVVLLRVLW